MKKEEEEKEAAPAVEAFNPEENRGMGGRRRVESDF